MHNIATDAWYGLPSKRLRDNVLAEYKQTNYSVVNPLTIDAVSVIWLSTVKLLIHS